VIIFAIWFEMTSFTFFPFWKIN